MLANKTSIWICFRPSLPRPLAWLRHCMFSWSSVLSDARLWSKDEKDTLRRPKITRMPTKDILEALPGRTLNPIKTMWNNRLGPRDEQGELLHMDPRFITREELDHVCFLRKSGFTYPQIAKDHFPTRQPRHLLAIHDGYLVRYRWLVRAERPTALGSGGERSSVASF